MTRNRFFIVILCGLISAATGAQWTGAVSSDLADPNNWNPPADLLDAADQFVIGLSGPNPPVYNNTLGTRPDSFIATDQASFTMIGGELLPYGKNTFNGDLFLKNGWLNSRGYVYIGNGACGQGRRSAGDRG